MNKKEFYEECASITGIDTEFEDAGPIPRRFSHRHGWIERPMTLATRWGGREPGHGRFPGLGLIRAFSDSCIQINIINPRLVGYYNSYEDALTALRKVFKK